ncbi:MAG: epoxyqueuosine reductase [Firmicutes bacterium]|nr:epoxyqueuosine reductase [Bacillota bacterium]
MEKIINETIAAFVSRHRGGTAYRRPLTGFASAADPLFHRLKELVGPGHLLPSDLLPSARSVVAFFIPFTGELVRANRNHPYVSRQWAEAYIETNRLISSICEHLASVLSEKGVRAAWQEPTHNFDPVTLTSFWSHKHVAYLCGLGTFGRNHLLITSAGCAGRLGSLALDAPLEPSPAPGGENCLFRRGEECTSCMDLCPAGALTEEGLDRQKCYLRLQEVDAYFSDLGPCSVCGKCAAGPCALVVP